MKSQAGERQHRRKRRSVKAHEENTSGAEAAIACWRNGAGKNCGATSERRSRRRKAAAKKMFGCVAASIQPG